MHRSDLARRGTLEATEKQSSQEMRDFAEVLARALFSIVLYLNKRYQLGMRLRDER